ncbi:recombinase RecT [Hydrogenimonas sp.]
MANEIVASKLKNEYGKIKALLNTKEKTDRFYAAAVEIASDYQLSQCNPDSVVKSCLTVAMLDLNIDKVSSEVYLVPFKTKKGGKLAQLIVSARGYKKIAARYGIQIKEFAVFDCDEFDYSFDGWEEKIIYRPNFDDRMDDDPKWAKEHLKCVFAVAKLPNEETAVEVMSRALIDKHRRAGQNSDGDVWKQWFIEMALKTVVKKLAKKLPMGDGLMKAVAAEVVEETDYVEAKPVKEPEVDLNKIQTKPKETEAIDATVEAPKSTAATGAKTGVAPTSSQKADRNGISTAVAAKYPDFIQAGLSRTDCNGFVQHYGITAENIDSIMADPEGLNQMVAEYRAMVATPELPI